MNKVTPFLWYDGTAEEAAKFYTSLLKGSKITSTSPMSTSFEIDGREFIAFNGGPHFKFNESISLFINCETQEEVDDLWEKLSAGGEKSRCGWLKDKYGLWWQVVPSILGKLLGDKDRVKANRVMQAMMKMSKLDIKGLEDAYNGK